MDRRGSSYSFSKLSQVKNISIIWVLSTQVLI